MWSPTFDSFLSEQDVECQLSVVWFPLYSLIIIKQLIFIMVPSCIFFVVDTEFLSII